MTVTVSDSGILFADGSLQPTALTTGTQTIAGAKTFSTAPTFANVPTVSTPQSMVRLNTSNGNGSTNTAIRRFTNVVTNQGSDITYADSATNGASFTINTSGVYSISYSDNFTASNYLGISINSSQLATSVSGINVSDVLASDWQSVANINGHVAWTGYLAAGSVIRAHTNTAPGNGTFPSGSQFTIVRVS